jgi:hypothetical protein
VSTDALRTYAQGLQGLAPTSGWLGGRTVSLAPSGATYWGLGIRPSTFDPFAPYAWGLRFHIVIDSGYASLMNRTLRSSDAPAYSSTALKWPWR